MTKIIIIVPTIYTLTLLQFEMYKGDITRWREDFKTTFYERAQQVSKILFLAQESQNHASSVECVTKIIIIHDRPSKRHRGDITRWREDMNFIFGWQNNILRTRAASE